MELPIGIQVEAARQRMFVLYEGLLLEGCFVRVAGLAENQQVVQLCCAARKTGNNFAEEPANPVFLSLLVDHAILPAERLILRRAAYGDMGSEALGVEL